MVRKRTCKRAKGERGERIEHRKGGGGNEVIVGDAQKTHARARARAHTHTQKDSLGSLQSAHKRLAGEIVQSASMKFALLDERYGLDALVAGSAPDILPFAEIKE